MPFQPGNTYGGKRPNSGRPRKGALQAAVAEFRAAETAANKARARLEGDVDKIMGTYLGLATSGQDSATTRHAVDKLLPDEQIQPQVPVVNVLIAPGGGNKSQPELRANGIQISLGGVNGRNGNGSDGS